MRHPNKVSVFFAFFISCAALMTTSLAAQDTITSTHHAFALVPVLRGLDRPWALGFLPDGRILVTERPGRLLLVTPATGSQAAHAIAVEGTPEVWASGQGGLLDITHDPAFTANKTLYFSWSKPGRGGAGTAVSRAVLAETDTGKARLVQEQVIFEMEKKTTRGQHFGSRIRFLPDGTLIFSTGDRGDMDRAQDLMDAAGKIHRINTDGSIPAGNPFTARRDALPSIYSYGHRNPQGLFVDAAGNIWITEHGPQGGDELNLVEAGKNYGWPVITHGRQYGSGAKIGEGTHKAGMEQPLAIWTPSLAPSGLDSYRGSAFPRWHGDLFSGNLAGQRLVRLRMNGRQLVEEEELLRGTLGRIRDVKTGPDGFLYLLQDGPNAGLWRLEPKDQG